ALLVERDRVDRADRHAAHLHLIAGDQLAGVVERRVDAVGRAGAEKQERDEDDRHGDRESGHEPARGPAPATDRQATPPADGSHPARSYTSAARLAPPPRQAAAGWRRTRRSALRAGGKSRMMRGRSGRAAL